MKLDQMSEKSLICPNCHQIDRVQKVSSIYSSGVASRNYSGSVISDSSDGLAFGSTQMRGTSTILISQRLAPPVKPEYSPDFFSVFLGFGLGGLMVIGGILSFSLLGILSVLAGLALIYWGNAMNNHAKTKAQKDIPIWNEKMSY